MTKNWAVTLGAGTGAVTIVALVLYLSLATTEAETKVDLKPGAHWVFDSAGVDGKKVVERAGKLNGTLLGSAKIARSAPTERLEMNGPNDGVLVRDRVPEDADFLPKESFSLVGWVRIDEPTEWGGIIGCMQDNAPVESGFLLGYNRSTFYFGLATQTKKRIVYLTGKTKYEPGKWYHVAGVYDGKQMQLYVNGQLDAKSEEQKGPVLYAKPAPFVIGRYRDENEDYPMRGAIKEVMLCPHAVSGEQVASHFEADKALAEVPSVIQPGPRFVVEPYLQFVTSNSITVMWETEGAVTGRVEYGTTYPPKQSAESEKADTMGEIVLSNLEPGTKYFYRVICTDAEGRKLESKSLTFMTATGPDEAFSFTIVGDTQRNPAITAKVAKLMWERRPNFVVHCGDVVDDGAAKWQWTGDLFKPCNELFGRVTVFPCIGNHEKNHPDYYKYFSLPKPKYYYSFKYGNAEFFVLDTNTRRDLTEKGEQYKWLDKALAASEAKWKFCYHHHPAYSSDDDDFGNSWRGPTTSGDMRVRSFVKLYEKYNVDVVFNGHIHVYERTWPIRAGKVDQKTGVVYLTSGGGGGALENFAPTPAFFKQEFRSDYHFCYVTINRGTFNLKAIDHEGRLFDQLSLKKE
jgi:predicted phosphodiesterase